jgi:hypothetical protein
MMRIDGNSCYYSPDHRQHYHVIETPTIWGETTCRAWLHGRDYATIFTVAHKIPENVLQEDPKLLMWYDQVITRMGGD